jgi:hypothetical protein
MVEREYKRNDKGRFMSAEEMKAAELEKTDAAMNRWIVSRTIGPNSRKAQLARRIFGTPKPQEK